MLEMALFDPPQTFPCCASSGYQHSSNVVFAVFC